MTTESIDIGIGARLRLFEETLRKMPGMTDREIKATVKVAGKSFQALDRQAASSTASLGKGVQAATSQIKKLGEVAQGSLGPVLGRLGGAVELVSGLGAAGGPAAAAAAAIAGLGVGVGVVAGALVSTVYQADELIERQQELARLGAWEPISAESVAAIQRASDSSDALSAVWDRIVVITGANLAPAINDVSVELVALSLAAADAWEAWTNGKNVLREFFVYVVDSLIQNMTGPLAWALEGLSLIGDALEGLGVQGAGNLGYLNDRFEELTRSAAEWTVDGLAPAAAGVLELGGVSADYREEAERLIGATHRLRTAEEDKARATREAAEATRRALELERALYKERARQEDLASDLGGVLADLREDLAPEPSTRTEEVIAQYGRFLQALKETRTTLRALGRSGVDVSGELEAAAAAAVELEAWRAREIEAIRGEEYRKLGERQAKAAEDAARLLASQREYGIGLLVGAFDLAGQLAEGLADRSAGAASAAIAIQKAAAILSIGISTGEAVVKAFALFGPPPSPVGIAAATAAGAIGLGQAAAVAATPVSFHSGGLAPDEGVRRLQKGEGVLSSQGVEALAAINRGAGGGGSGVTVIRPDHRVFDVEVSRASSRRGAPLRDAIARAARSGRYTER